MQIRQRNILFHSFCPQFFIHPTSLPFPSLSKILILSWCLLPKDNKLIFGNFPLIYIFCLEIGIDVDQGNAEWLTD